MGRQASSRFFEKKRRKKLLLCRAMGGDRAIASGPAGQKFFAPLFFKKAATFL
jgi:hypothetical protein